MVRNIKPRCIACYGLVFIWYIGSQPSYAVFNTIINAPPTIIGDLGFIDSSTQLNVASGGSVGNWFAAGRRSETNHDIEVNISGGVVGSQFDAYNGSTVNISGGIVDFRFTASDGSIVNISGGTVGGGFEASDGSIVNISGGKIASSLGAARGSRINISGGTIGDYFRASDSDITISGGTFGHYFDASFSSRVNISGGSYGDLFSASHSSFLNLFGNDFRLDGIAITGLSTIGNTAQQNIPADTVFSGTFTDGTPFAFSSFDYDRISDGSLTLHATTLPPVGPATILVPTASAPPGIRSGQTLTVSNGGVVGDHFNADWGSTVNVTGGSVGENFEATGAQVTITGGLVGPRFSALTGSTTNISGGSIGNQFGAFKGSAVTLTGGEFRLNGVPIAVNSTLPFNLPEDSTLTGTFADGIPFAFSSLDYDSITNGTLTLQKSALPSPGPSVIIASSDPVPPGVREGQTLIVDSGAALGDHFNAGWGSTVNVAGGTVGNEFNANSGSLVNISGGSVGEGFNAFSGSVVNISGGSVGNAFEMYNGVKLNITNGSVGENLRARVNNTINISGGSIGNAFRASQSMINMTDGMIGNSFSLTDSVVTISGGSIGSRFRVKNGSEVTISGGLIGDDFEAEFSSIVNLLGLEFILDGIDITDSLIQNSPFTIADRDVTLSGLLADGTAFSFNLNSTNGRGGTVDYFSPDATLTITMILPGDFNNDGTVDAADYTVWRDAMESSIPLPNDSTPGIVDASDYDVWKSHFGESISQTATAATVPEPSTLACFVLLLLTTQTLGIRRRY